MKKNFSGKKVSVLGLGVSGFESARFLARRGARVFVSEILRSETALEYERILEKDGVEVELGKHSEGRILESDWIVISPGIKPSAAIFQAVQKKRGNALISEIELAFWFCPCEIIAVTGTNGKTTTTSLIAGLFKAFGIHAVACGNIGNPFVAEIDQLTAESKAVVEVSSFQLENTKEFRPHVGLLLNVTPDHFDWHGSMEAYLRAKAKVFTNQRREDFAVLNYRDEPTRAILSSIPSRVVYFHEGEVENPNWDAVLKVADIYGLAPEQVMVFLKGFPGIDHRMEKVPSQDGLVYINDSKSTNPSSLEWALARMKGPAILICGGRNKGSDFRLLAPLIQKKVRVCIVFGEASGEMMLAWREAVPVKACRDLEEALRAARQEAKTGDTVLFSPACASFDQFKNYKERGHRFKQLVSNTGLQPAVF